MTAFPTHFRDHVMPRLRQQVAVQAFLVACGSTSYAEGYDVVLAAARRYGALRLPERLRIDGRTVRPLLELEDWISTSLLTGILQAEPRIAEIEAEIAAADPVAHYEELAAASRNPDQMRWTFAAINPEYRAYLQAVRRAPR